MDMINSEVMDMEISAILFLLGKQEVLRKHFEKISCAWHIVVIICFLDAIYISVTSIQIVNVIKQGTNEKAEKILP